MKSELFREINGRFLPNELGDPTFLVHLFKESTTLHDTSKFEEFFISQFSNSPHDSLLQSDFRRFTGSVQALDLPIISLLSILRQLLRRFTLILFCNHKNNAYISLLVITLLT